MGKSTRRTNYKNSVTNLEIKLKYKQRTSYLHCVHPPLTVGSGSRPFYQIFKGGGGLTGSQLLEGGCWETGDELFQGGCSFFIKINLEYLITKKVFKQKCFSL